MVIPWVGYSLEKLISQVEPTGNAKYVEFVTAVQPEAMPGVRGRVLDWPYIEALRLDEARHPLTMLVFGVYGQVLPNQNGAPLRLAVPWKYGFKSGKSLVKIRFTEKQPKTSWIKAAAREYGFYANVNPNVDHPRWSQATERRIGEDGFFKPKRKTLMFNGYADQVASRYQGMDARKVARELMEKVVTCNADVCVLALQDLLGLGDDARMNVPGVAEGNWAWRLQPGMTTAALAEEIRELTRTFARC